MTPDLDTSWIDRTEYPFQSHFFDLPIGRMHYLDEGSGEPVLFVHGTPEWSFGYRKLIKNLSPRYRCIVPDHIGFGLSDKPVDWSYKPVDHAQNLSQFIAHLDLDGITLVVHDFGGPIGLAYALDHPDKIKRVVIMNTWLWSLADQPRYAQASRLFGSPLGKFLYKRLNFSSRVMIPLSMGDKSKWTKAVHQHYIKALPTPDSRQGTWVLAKELAGSGDWYDSLWQRRQVLTEMPAMLIWGMADSAFPPDVLARWQEVLPQAQVKPLEGIGHFVQEEAGEQVAELIAEFIEAFSGV